MKQLPFNVLLICESCNKQTPSNEDDMINPQMMIITACLTTLLIYLHWFILNSGKWSNMISTENKMIKNNNKKNKTKVNWTKQKWKQNKK